jgi:hypothetical protein
MAKRLLCSVVFLLLAGRGISGHAADDHIRFVQATSGAITAFLVGTVDPCGGSHIFPMGPSSVGRSGNQFDVSSAFSILDPPSCPHTPDPYQISADLGALPDGEYTVVWTVGPLVVHGAFIVLNGQLQAVATPAPALDLRALVTLLALVAGIGILARWREARGRPARAQPSAGTYRTNSRRHECW